MGKEVVKYYTIASTHLGLNLRPRLVPEKELDAVTAARALRLDHHRTPLKGQPGLRGRGGGAVSPCPAGDAGGGRYAPPTCSCTVHMQLNRPRAVTPPLTSTQWTSSSRVNARWKPMEGAMQLYRPCAGPPKYALYRPYATPLSAPAAKNSRCFAYNSRRFMPANSRRFTWESVEGERGGVKQVLMSANSLRLTWESVERKCGMSV